MLNWIISNRTICINMDLTLNNLQTLIIQATNQPIKNSPDRLYNLHQFLVCQCFQISKFSKMCGRYRFVTFCLKKSFSAEPNGCRCLKCNRQFEFNPGRSYLRFTSRKYPLEKIWIHLFSSQPWINSKKDWIL